MTITAKSLVYWEGAWRTVGVVESQPGFTTILNSTLESATVANPISNANMWTFIGANYGGTSNFVRTSVRSVPDGPFGTTSKVLNQHFTAGQYSTGDGIALTGVPLTGAFEEASIEMHVRFLSNGTPWGWGGKIPGLGGVRPGFGNPPTGGNPSVNGWTGRSMWITPSAGFGSENPLSPVEWIGYIYDPTQGSGFGQNRRTRKVFVKGQWHHIKQYYKMNTVTTEGSTSPTPNGIHRMYFDGALCFEKTNQIFRYYTAAKITHMVWDNFYGGGTVDWAPTSDTDMQFDNLLITTP